MSTNNLFQLRAEEKNFGTSTDDALAALRTSDGTAPVAVPFKAGTQVGTIALTNATVTTDANGNTVITGLAAGNHLIVAKAFSLSVASPLV